MRMQVNRFQMISGIGFDSQLPECVVADTKAASPRIPGRRCFMIVIAVFLQVL